jgi:hypothetical protein
MADCQVEPPRLRTAVQPRQGGTGTDLRSQVEQALNAILGSIPPSARRAGRGLRVRTDYVAEAIVELEHLRRGRGRALASSEILRRVRQRVLADLFDPAFSLGNELIVIEAAGIARANIASAKRSWLRQRFGDVVVDEDAAESAACEALVQVGKAMCDPDAEPVRDFWAFLATIIDREVSKLHSRQLCATAPGLYASQQTRSRIERAVRKERPELDPVARKELLDERASTEVARLGWSKPFSREEVSEAHIEAPDPFKALENMDVIRAINRLVCTARFTDFDRKTWRLLLKAVANGGSGANIPWAELRVDPHTGAQRLHSLLEKIRQAVGEALS